MATRLGISLETLAYQIHTTTSITVVIEWKCCMTDVFQLEHSYGQCWQELCLSN